MKNALTTVLIAAGSIIFFSCNKSSTSPDNGIEIIKATGDINDAVLTFKNMLGPLNTAPGSVGGHREINWDAVPDSLLINPCRKIFLIKPQAMLQQPANAALLMHPVYSL